MPCDTRFQFYSTALCLAVSERKNGPNELGQIYNISSPTPYIQTSPTRANNNFGIYIRMILKWAVRMKCVCALVKGTMQTAICVCVWCHTVWSTNELLKKSKKKSESIRATSTHSHTHTQTLLIFNTHTSCSDSPSPARAEIAHSSSSTWIINLDCMCMHVYMPTERVCVSKCVCVQGL